MKIHKKPLILLVLILVLLQVVVTAQVAASDRHDVSEQESRELIAFVQRFVVRMQKTRDVEPLLREFFVSSGDMAAYLGSELEDGDYRPNAAEGRRFTIIATNLVYTFALSQIIRGADYRVDIRSILPARLARPLDRSYDELIDSLEVENGRRFRALLPPVERHMKAAQQYLRRKNYEHTASYIRVIEERKKEDFYNFHIDLWSSCSPDDKEELACWALRFGPETRVYNVGTPYGLGPVIIKSKAGYKILFIYPHPMSG
jgi:hypothetical protein